MKLYVDHKFDDSGKGKFMSRLKPELEKLGVEFTDFKSCDIVLGLNKYRKNVGKTKRREIKDKKKRVLRLDGIHLVKSKRNIWANRIVKQDADRSHAIIWQSEFCRKMWKGIMKIKAAKEYIIFNGANPDDYKNVKPIESDYPNNVIISGKFFSGKRRNNKGLATFIKVAKEYSRGDTCFWIAGRNDLDTDNLKSDRLRFLNHLPELELRRYLKMADCLLYVSYFEWCSNSVVEALVSGLPVICSSSDGTVEIVRDNGVVINAYPKWKPKMIKRDNPPDIDRSKIIEALDKLLDSKPRVVAPYLHIDKIAESYYKVFKEVLNG